MFVRDIVSEGIAAAKTGCAIVHVHAYDEDTGRQRDDWQIYARIIEGIRSQTDAIVYPTIPFEGEGRFSHVEELARRGLIEWMVLDPGSLNVARYDALVSDVGGFVYENSLEDIADGIRVARTFGVHPAYAIYEPGFTRLGAALARIEPPVPAPVYRFMFSEEFAWGFPPRASYLEAHLSLLHEVAGESPWMIGGLGVDILALVPHAVQCGGHVRVGLEDAPWGSERSNIDWVREAASRVAAAGASLASAGDVRSALRAGQVG